MEKDHLIFSDKVSIINNEQSKSDVFIKKELNQIEIKNLFQFEKFSFDKQNIFSNEAEKIFCSTFFKMKDVFFEKKINEKFFYLNDDFFINGDFIKSNSFEQKYKIIFPKENKSFFIGEYISFECLMETQNELLEECFDNLIWVSSLDGIIGINNKFKSILSCGEHVIYLLLKNVGSYIVKDETKIFVFEKELKLPEIVDEKNL